MSCSHRLAEIAQYLKYKYKVVWRLINKVGSAQTKFATRGSAGVTVISFVFWRVKYDV